MKKATLALLFVLSGLFFISSCSQEETPVPQKTASFYAVNKYSYDKEYTLYNFQSGYKDKNSQYILIASYGDLDYNASTYISEVNYSTVNGEIFFFYRDMDGKLWRTDGVKLEAGQKTPYFMNENTRKSEIKASELPNKIN